EACCATSSGCSGRSGTSAADAASAASPNRAAQPEAASVRNGVMGCSCNWGACCKDPARGRKFSYGGIEQPALVVGIARHAIDEARLDPEGMLHGAVAEDVRHGPAAQGEIVSDQRSVAAPPQGF